MDTQLPDERQWEDEPTTGEQGIDVLAPWGDAGPPPPGRWTEDILGPDYQSQTLPLEPDSEGKNVATIVRLTPSLGPGVDADPHDGRFARRRRPAAAGSSRHTRRKPKFAVLYIHGRNDYFFHDEAARKIADMGGAFYALDLRKHGRSLRPWQTIGYATDLAVYDREIGLALRIVERESPNLPVIAMAHSTGGLIATLWAWKNPGRLSGLILNSAWLELQIHTSMRPAIHQVALRLGSIRPRASIVGASKTNSYFRSLTEGWKDSGLAIPDYFTELPDDPAFVGWRIFPEWKWPYSYPAPAAWVAAVLEGHAVVEKGVHLDCPVLAMASTGSGLEFGWNEKLFHSDIVLDADVITERAGRLSNNVTITRFPGKHDLLLSDPPVRRAVYRTIRGWLRFAVLGDAMDERDGSRRRSASR